MQFTGPLFIVGMPRSGTKLVRDLLNRHPRISLPVSESHFIPSMVRLFGITPRLDDERWRERLYAVLTRTTFFHDMKARGHVLPRSQLEQARDTRGWSDLLEIMLRFYGQCENDADIIWGDKTPQYLVHMEMLKDLCPEARFVHIVRDPRDYCLSVRKAWGKSVERAAERWRRDVAAARQSGMGLGGDYLEVTYERLVSEPAGTLGLVCAFLGCEMAEQMMSTGRSTENLGAARGRSDILPDNFGKYRCEFAPAEIRRIEEIAQPLMVELGYAFEHEVSFRALSAPRRLAATIGDAWAMTRFHAKTRGLLGGVRYQARAYAQVTGRPTR